MKAWRVLQEREGWRSASIMPGVLSAIVCLAQRMLQLLANNWEDSTERVNTYRLLSVPFNPLPVVAMIARYILHIMAHLYFVSTYIVDISFVFLVYILADATAIPNRVPGRGPIFLDRLDCNQNDVSLLECRSFSRYSLGLPQCDHSQDVSIRCRGKQVFSQFGLMHEWYFIVFSL